LAHQIGEFNRQLQSGALSASPLTSSVAGLPDDMRQIVSSLDRLEVRGPRTIVHVEYPGVGHASEEPQVRK